MAKVFNNVQEVKEARQGNEPVLFNKAAALMALKSTPKAKRTVSGGSLGEISNNILECFKAAGKGTEVSTGQLIAMYAAATGKELDKVMKKKISDKVWGLAHGKNPVLNHNKEAGVYSLI